MELMFAYHPITFLPDRNQAGETAIVEAFTAGCLELAELGWQGIEFSADMAMQLWPDPQEYRRTVTGSGLTPLTLYTPYGVTDSAEFGHMDERARRAFDYVASAGCGFALLDGGRHSKGAELNQETAVLAESANRLASLAAEAGTRGIWHQHFGTVIEGEEQLHLFMESIDPGLVGLCFDTAQLTLGGIPVKETFERYRESIQYVHFKDLDGQRRMRELGGGDISFDPLRDILVRAGFSGWICTDLDYVTDIPANEAASKSLLRLRELFA